MYFNQFTDEFYNRGGWKYLELVAVSYNLPIFFLGTFGWEPGTVIERLLIKARKAMDSYRRFKRIGIFDHDKCFTISWIKFYSRCPDKNSDNDFAQFPEDYHSNRLTYSEIEDILKQIKYLCDPNGSEMVKHMVQMSSIESLEITMNNLNILKSKVETVLEAGLDKNTIVNSASKLPKKLNGKIKNITKTDHTEKDIRIQNKEWQATTTVVEHLFENMTISDYEGINEVNSSEILTAQLSSPIKNTEKDYSNKILYDSSDEQDENIVIKEAIDNDILTEQIVSKKQIAGKRNSNEIQNVTRKEQKRKIIKRNRRNTSKNAEKENTNEDATQGQEKKIIVKKINISTEEKDITVKNSNKMKDDKSKNDCKIMKNEKKITNLSTQVSLPNRVVLKENGYHKRGDTRKQEEKAKTILTGQMSSTYKNDNKEKESGDSIRKEREDYDVKKLLRMILVLGTK